MMRDHEIQQLPVPLLANQNALVVTWVTNKQHQHRLVKDTLYPKWGVQPLATWYWLKVGGGFMSNSPIVRACFQVGSISTLSSHNSKVKLEVSRMYVSKTDKRVISNYMLCC